jgi:hypothetical protein
MQTIRNQLQKQYYVLDLEFFFSAEDGGMMLEYLEELTIKRNEKVILYHSENIDFYTQWMNKIEMRDLRQLIDQQRKKICVVAHGVNHKFPFEYINHYDFWIDIRNKNDRFKILNRASENEKDFLFLTRRPTEHRRQLREKLQVQGCLDNSLYSYVEGENTRHLPPEYEHVKFHDPKFKDKQCHYEPAIWNVLPQQYDATKYSIVAETVETNGVHCLSEKIFKPLIGGHLFVVLAGTGYLSYLRSIGFKTFNDCIDESYDNEPDTELRIKKIVETCKNLMDADHRVIQEKIQDVIQHNHKLFFDDCHLQSLNTHIMAEVKDHFGEV